MGIFDFVRDAGETLKRAVGLGGPDAEDLAKALADNGLHITDLKLAINDETAVIAGQAPTFEVKEKAVLVVGNTKGIAKVDDRLTLPPPPVEAAAPPPPPAPRFYTVVRGDNLSKIAKAHYGSASKYPLIFEANKPMLKHPDKIYPGQVLRIPELDDSATA